MLWFTKRPLFLYRLVGKDHRARPGRLCGDELHSFERIPFFEQAFPAACNYWVDQEYQLIEKILLEERVYKARTPSYANVLSWLLLEFSKFLGEIALEEGRVAPLDAFQGV